MEPGEHDGIVLAGCLTLPAGRCCTLPSACTGALPPCELRNPDKVLAEATMEASEAATEAAARGL